MSSFDKIIGYEDIKVELIRICDAVKNPEKYDRLGVHMPSGIMLHGDPGLGKTLMAKCFIEESGCKEFIIRKDKPNGDFVNVIRNVFEQAKTTGRAIVFLDDLDKFANQDNEHPDAEEYVAVQAGIDACKGSGVFVIATANDRWCLPESLLRPGRFDKVIEVECPKGKEAVKVVQYYLSQKNSMDEVDAEEIAKIMKGKSCADIESVINEAGIYAGFEGREKISHQDMVRACMRMLFEGPECVTKEEDPRAKNYAVHEAGHTVVAEVLEPGCVNFVSINVYSGGSRGVTSFDASWDFGKTKEMVENNVACKLAGKAATEVVLGQVDFGCSDDLMSAFRSVTQMADTLCVYNFDPCAYYQISEALREKKEQLVSTQMTNYYQKAKQILAENRVFLDAVVKALLEKKTLTQRDIREIRNKL